MTKVVGITGGIGSGKTTLSNYLKEKVGIHRWTAVLIGFFGVMIIIRPGFIEIN